jgi:hypothetical protein
LEITNIVYISSILLNILVFFIVVYLVRIIENGNKELRQLVDGFNNHLISMNDFLKKIDQATIQIDKNLLICSRDSTDNKFELLKALSDLRLEAIEEQTAKFKVNEAIRKAMEAPRNDD